MKTSNFVIGGLLLIGALLLARHTIIPHRTTDNGGLNANNPLDVCADGAELLGRLHDLQVAWDEADELEREELSIRHDVIATSLHGHAVICEQCRKALTDDKPNDGHGD